MSASFQQALKKGAIGERTVRAMLEDKGFVVYLPVTEGAHAFDIMAIKDKTKVIALDVKSKARRTKYNDTGIDQKHFDVYLSFSEKHNMDFWLVFVDEHEKRIYGNSIRELEKGCVVGGKKYPIIERNARDGKQIRYWHISQMHHFQKINEAVSAQLMEYSQRNYSY